MIPRRRRRRTEKPVCMNGPMRIYDASGTLVETVDARTRRRYRGRSPIPFAVMGMPWEESSVGVYEVWSKQISNQRRNQQS